jgi:hypothetical protein
MLAFISEGRACQCYCPIRRQRVWIEKQSCFPVRRIAGEHHILVLQSRVLEVVPSLCMSRQRPKVSAGVATSFQWALLAGVGCGPHTHRMQFSEPLVGIATLKLIMCTSFRASAVERVNGCVTHQALDFSVYAVASCLVYSKTHKAICSCDAASGCVVIQQRY